MSRRVVAGLVVAAVALAVAGVALVWRPSLPRVAGAAAALPATEVRRGQTLAEAGFCSTCHTAANGAYLAGGRPLETPFGTIYGANITPDPDTGIGGWSLAAFVRAMREGVARDGSHLYPAFPYDHFTRLNDDDLKSLYAFVMTRPPVRREVAAPDFPFPLNLRPVLAGWKLLFLRENPFRPDPAKGAPWNRGAYIAEALSHCAACHAPRNSLGAEQSQKGYAGGEAEDWWAPPLAAGSPSPLPWSEEQMFNYLRAWDSNHGGAEGPMKAVVLSLARLPDADVRALATYATSLYGPPIAEAATRTTATTMAIAARSEPGRRSAAIDRGEATFKGACATCHESGAAVPFTVRSLAQHTSVAGPDPRNVIHVVLDGIRPIEGHPGAIMPGFRNVLDQAQIVDLLAYIRARYTDRADWPNAAAEVDRIAGAGDGAVRRSVSR